jgi:hypothetical protein
METTTIIDSSATLAKCELLARLHNNHVHKFVARTGAELSAYLHAEIASARCGPAPIRDFAGDDDELELVEPVPVPARRQRRRSLAKVCEAARRAGADRVIVDGIVIALSPSAAVPETDANEWDAVLSEVDHGPH